MANEVILVVEDEIDILESIRSHLLDEGFSVIGAMRGEDAYYKAVKHAPDLIVLALVLPGVTGLEVFERLKNDERTHHIPIVLLAAKGGEADVVAGLELGAVHYLTKPFGPPELSACLRAVLERRNSARPGDDESIVLHELAVHPGRHEMTVGGQLIHLTFTEFGVLRCLLRRPGCVFTRGQIVEAVRGADHVVTARVVDVQIAGLRKKLGDAGRYIETVRGIGYRFKE